MIFKVSNNTVSAIIVIGILSLTAYVYAPGLLGGYYLDDVANLSNLAVYSRFDGFEGLIRYVLSYDSGLLKRPISTLSFLLNSRDFTVNAFQFKLTNLFIHLFNGFMLYVVTLKILKTFDKKMPYIRSIAITNMSIWMLHPFFVSTTLYVVQRMAMLPVTFVLIGLNFYLIGREAKYKNTKMGLFYIITAIYICTFLAVLSKENGVILPFLILLLEYIIINKSNAYKINKVLKYFLYFPPFIIVASFAYKIPTFILEYANRDYSLLERLYTQSRVIIDYLIHLINPSSNTEGVYTDGYIISTSLFTPVSTLFSIVAIFVIIIWSIEYKDKYPLIAFSILFFFISHIIESSFIPLEMYFEHRNYLPSLFLFFPVSIYIYKFFNQFKLHYMLSILIIIYLSFLTYMRTSLWGDNTKLLNVAVNNFPNSIRAIEQKVVNLYQDRNFDQAVILLEKSIKIHPNASLRINLVNIKCSLNQVKNSDFNNLKRYFNKHNLTRNDASSLSVLLTLLSKGVCIENGLEIAQDIVNTLKSNKGYNIAKNREMLIPHEILILQKLGEYEAAYNLVRMYLSQYNDFNKVLDMIKVFIDLGQLHFAEKLLDNLNEKLNEPKYRYTKMDYLQEVKILKKKLNLILD